MHPMHYLLDCPHNRPRRNLTTELNQEGKHPRYRRRRRHLCRSIHWGFRGMHPKNSPPGYRRSRPRRNLTTELNQEGRHQRRL